MTGMPYSFLRLGYQGKDEEYFDIEYENATLFGIDDMPPHKHNEPTFYEDDDFFRENSKNNPAQFKALLENYTFALHYTGMRWHGRLSFCVFVKYFDESW
jgi:hypothetical protein